MFDTKITTDFEDPKKALDEIALARCAVMAAQSLYPEAYDAFLVAYHELIKIRKLQNKPIT